MTTLVLLPGIDGTGRLFAPFQRAVGAAARVVVIPYPTERFLPYDELTAYVRARLPAEPFVLVAESYAGPLAVMVAAARPPGLRAVVLTCTFVTASVPVPYALARRVVPWLPFRRVPARMALWVLSDANPTAEADREFSEIVHSLPDAVLAARVLATIGVDARAALARVEVPTLYVQGTRDLLMGGRHARHIRRLRPATAVAKVRGPHFMLQTKPAEAWAAIADFLRQNSLLPAPGAARASAVAA